MTVAPRLLLGAIGVLVAMGVVGCSGESPEVASVAVADLDVEDTRPTSGTPRARSGDLGQEDLPAPEQLGQGWEYRVDPGSAEEGYAGSGEPANARDPLEVLGAITPLGCRPGTLPVPTHALEVTYGRGVLPAVGLLLRFDDDATATAFFDAHTDVISDCVGRRTVEVAVIRSESGVFVSSRTEQLGQTPTWVEGVGLRGAEVLLVAVADAGPSGVRAVEAALG